MIWQIGHVCTELCNAGVCWPLHRQKGEQEMEPRTTTLCGSTELHLVVFDLEAWRTPLVASVLSASHTGNLQHTEQTQRLPQRYHQC
ncbi:hypothetical protein EYF80_021517 [Liparis tanakae]|uniref:Uncharacterized protein n=1 Tax=Liparis tanakae TaxID=230148 RepID=A0A4Z2HSD3_9TELE|nr:hypothetical protein EYF80_021517 [Liparis tanakae]